MNKQYIRDIEKCLLSERGGVLCETSPLHVVITESTVRRGGTSCANHNTSEECTPWADSPLAYLPASPPPADIWRRFHFTSAVVTRQRAHTHTLHFALWGWKLHTTLEGIFKHPPTDKEKINLCYLLSYKTSLARPRSDYELGTGLVVWSTWCELR